MSQESEKREMTTYSIWRTGSKRKRHYQLNKLIMGVAVEKYWVELNGRQGFFCDCPGFKRQKFPAVEHKHVKVAMDFSLREEPYKALYRIIGTGATATIEYLGAKA